MYQLNQQSIASVAGGINNPGGCIPELPIFPPIVVEPTYPEYPDYPEYGPFIVEGGSGRSTQLQPEEYDLET